MLQLLARLRKTIFMQTLLLCSSYAFATEALTTVTTDKPNFAITAKHPIFVVKLKSNPTTGYSWFLREYNSNLIVPIKHTYEAENKKLVGSFGYEYWTFQVKKAAFLVPQQTALKFVYTRPWENSDTPKLAMFWVATQAMTN